MQNNKTEKSSLRLLSNQSLTKIVVQGININSLLSMNDPGLQEPIQKEIVFGVLRYFFFLESYLSRHLKQDIKDKDIAEALELPAIKLHCSVLAEESIKKAIEDWYDKKYSDPLDK